MIGAERRCLRISMEKACREYAKKRANRGGSRRDLEDLRAAINHHSAEGYHRGIVKAALPPKG